MKYTVELKYINPSHEHVSLRRRVDTVTRLVEASSEQEAINRAANQQRALGFMIKEASVVKPEVIKEEVEQIDEASNKYEVTKTKSRKMPMEFDSEAKMHHYDVHHNDKRVGTLTHDTYFGGTNGKLHGKELPNIRNYGDNPHNQLHNFLKSKTGQKWAANLHKYQKEEVEQIDEVNEKQIKKDLDSGMSHDAVIGKHANKKLTNTDAIRKVIKQHAFDKRMKKEEVEQVDEAEREAGYKMSPAVKAAQAKSDALSKVKKPAQAGTLAAQKAKKAADKMVSKAKNNKTVNLEPSIEAGKENA